jgi:hypothetical protein
MAIAVVVVCAVGLACSRTKVMAEEADEQEVKPVFAFVALNRLTSLTAAQVTAGLRATFPEDVAIADVNVDENGVSFSVDGRAALYAYIDSPIPWADLEGPCRTSLLWPEATRSMKKHKAHLIVFLVGGEGAHLERCVILTKLLSAATRTFDAAGTYWGHGNVVVSPKQTHEFAKKASVENPPVLMWIGMFPQKNANRTITAITEGLEYFDCMEIEVVGSKQPLKAIMNMMAGAAYITIKGEVIEDGDTVGAEGGEKIKTRYAESVADRETDAMVLRIEM